MVAFHGGAEGSGAQHVPRGDETFLGEDRGDLRSFARTAVDAGADLVVGSGPHVVRGMEFYKGHLIAYSAGNFVGYGGVFGLAGPTAVSYVLHVRAALRRALPLGPDDPHAAERIRASPSTIPRAGDRPGALAHADDFPSTGARIAKSGAIRPPRSNLRPSVELADGQGENVSVVRGYVHLQRS